MARKQLASAVGALERGLSRVGRHMLIGGVAVIARGVRRLTDDVDAALWAEGVDLDGLLRTLAGQDIRARVEDAVAFAERSQVLLLRHEPTGIDVDLSLARLPFEDEALDRADSLAIGRHRVRVATPEDLIIYKTIAARQRDRDIRSPGSSSHSPRPRWNAPTSLTRAPGNMGASSREKRL